MHKTNNTNNKRNKRKSTPLRVDRFGLFLMHWPPSDDLLLGKVKVRVHPCIRTNGLYTKGTRAHTHRELIREWLSEPKGNSLEYI